LPLDGADQAGLALLLAKRLNGSHPDSQAVAQTTARDVRPRGVHGCATSPERIDRAPAEVDERKRSGSRVGQDVEVERRGHLEGFGWKLADEVLPANSRQMRADAGDQRRIQNAQSEKVGQARSFARAIEIEQMPRVLPMSVVERVVRMLLVVERSDAGPLESSREAELPHERALDVARERPRGSSVARERCVKVVVGDTEREQSAPFPLLEDYPSNHATRRRRDGDGSIILEPDHDVESDGLACQAAIVRGMMKTIVGRSIVGAMNAR
jgi:hypothetical protein